MSLYLISGEAEIVSVDAFTGNGLIIGITFWKVSWLCCVSVVCLLAQSYTKITNKCKLIPIICRVLPLVSRSGQS